jgi:hypothetical protein
MLSKKCHVSTASPRIEFGGQDRDNRVTPNVRLIKNGEGASVPNAELERLLEVERSRKEQANHTTRTLRECGQEEPKGVDKVEVVANNIPSMWNEQLAQIGCDKKRSSKKVTAQQLSIVLMDISYTGRTVLALYETLVEGRPYRWVAERYGLNSDSFKVARSRVLALITSLDKSQVG